MALPCGVKVYANGMGCYKLSSIELYKGDVIIGINEEKFPYRLYEIKPYLRPISSMTDSERKEWYATFDSVYDLVPGGDPDNEDDYDDSCHDEVGIESYDYLNAHHFDFRGLIQRGLAIEVTKENNPYESNM